VFKTANWSIALSLNDHNRNNNSDTVTLSLSATITSVTYDPSFGLRVGIQYYSPMPSYFVLMANSSLLGSRFALSLNQTFSNASS